MSFHHPLAYAINNVTQSWARNNFFASRQRHRDNVKRLSGQATMRQILAAGSRDNVFHNNYISVTTDSRQSFLATKDPRQSFKWQVTCYDINPRRANWGHVQLNFGPRPITQAVLVLHQLNLYFWILHRVMHKWCEKKVQNPYEYRVKYA